LCTDNLCPHAIGSKSFSQIAHDYGCCGHVGVIELGEKNRVSNAHYSDFPIRPLFHEIIQNLKIKDHLDASKELWLSGNLRGSYLTDKSYEL
jgi:hypothetical protein